MKLIFSSFNFSDIQFKICDNAIVYYLKKLQVGKTFGLDSKLLLEGLTDGLPKQNKYLLVINLPQGTTEWHELVYR